MDKRPLTRVTSIKLDASDRIIQLVITHFPSYQTLETGLVRYLNNLFVLRIMNNLIPVIQSGNAEDASDNRVLTLYETLEETHIHRFRVNLICIRFFTAHLDLPQLNQHEEWQFYSLLRVRKIIRRCLHVKSHQCDILFANVFIVLAV